MWPEIAVRATPVPLYTDLLGEVEDDRDRQGVVLAGKGKERFSGLGPDVGGVDDCKPLVGEAARGDEMESSKGVGRCILVSLVVRHEAAKVVRRQDRGGQEVPGCEGRLTGAGSANEKNERTVRDRDLHRLNTAI